MDDLRMVHVQTPDGPYAMLRSVAATLLAKGVITGSLDSVLSCEDANALGAAAAAHGLCDFCSTPSPPVEVFDVPDFEMPHGLGRSTAGWAACAPCAALVHAGNRQELLARVAGTRSSVERQAIAKLHDLFWAARGATGVVTAQRVDEPGIVVPSQDTLRLLNQLKARVEALPDEGKRVWNLLLPEFSTIFQHTPGSSLEWIEKQDGTGGWTLAVGQKEDEPKVRAILQRMLQAVEKIRDDLPKQEIEIKPDSMDVKTFKPGTLALLMALKDRRKFLPPHTQALLEERWRKRDRGVQVIIDPRAGERMVMPQTVEDEEELVVELERQLGEVEDELTKIQYQKNSAHVVALEQQLLAYRVNAADIRGEKYLRGQRRSGLQEATIRALRSATPYCWAPKCVEAVATAGSVLDPESRPNEVPLGEYSAPGAAGWWWFERPIPLQTTIGKESVVALLWRREVRSDRVSIVDALDGEQDLPGPISLTWFNALIHEPTEMFGRTVLAPSPTLAWIWVDSVPIRQLEQNVSTRYRTLDAQKRAGREAAPADICTATAMWLSKLWLAGCVWLQERVIVGSQGMAVPRQQARQLAREHKLKEAPLVQVVYLRATEPGPPSEATGRSVDWNWRWTVRAHIRRQWYPSLGKHQLKTVKGHVKGPADKPLKITTKIYAVNR